MMESKHIITNKRRCNLNDMINLNLNSNFRRLIIFFLIISNVLLTLESSKVLSPIKGPKSTGVLKLSPIGCGTWSWGNRFLWKY